MSLNCAVSCGICASTCKDIENDCPGWASGGECSSNPGHVLKTCPVSCGLGSCPNTCADSNKTACIAWSMGDECLHNPGFMFKECPETCGVCSTVCENKHENRDCEEWALNGECEANPSMMRKGCPASCGICHQLERHFRFYNGKKDKDEL